MLPGSSGSSAGEGGEGGATTTSSMGYTYSEPSPRGSRHRRSRSDGGFLPPTADALGTPPTSYGLPKSRLSSVRKAVDYGFDAIQEEGSPRDSIKESIKESDLQVFSPTSSKGRSPGNGPVSHASTSGSSSSSSSLFHHSASTSSTSNSSSHSNRHQPDPLFPRQPEGSRPPRPNAARHRRIRSEDIVLAEQWSSSSESDSNGLPSPRCSPGVPVPLPRPDSKGLPPMSGGYSSGKSGLASNSKGSSGWSLGIPPKPTSSPDSSGDAGGDGAWSPSEGGDSSKGGGLGGIWDRRHKNKDKPLEISSLNLTGWRKSPTASPKAGLPPPSPPNSNLRTPPRSPKSPSPTSIRKSPRSDPKSPKIPASKSREHGGHPFEGPGLVIPNKSPFASPYSSPFTSPRLCFGISPKLGASIPSSPGSLIGSPSTMAAQAEVDRVKLMEIQGMFQFKQSYQSPKAEGRGPFVAKPVRTPNVSDYYRTDSSPQVYLPSMACVLRKPYRDIREFYRIAEKELGRGNFGVIRVAERLDTGERCAVKTISKEKLECWEDVEDVKREVQIMEGLKGHPHIISILETFEDHKEVHLLMELCEGGELFDRILERGYYAERQAAKVCRTMAEVLEFIHARGIVHRDLKPENVLLISKKSDTRIKVIDFGMAIHVKPGERCRLRAGTPNYIAPEVIAKNYAAEADVWSVGVILYVLLCGLPPFWGDTTEDVFKSVLTQELDFETEPWPVVSIAAKDLVRRMLTRDYKKRLTPTEILNHPWIKTLT